MPSEVRFADIRKNLESHGWELKRIKGSHDVFGGPGRPIVVIPVHNGKLKAVYARVVENAIQAWLASQSQGGHD